MTVASSTDASWRKKSGGDAVVAFHLARLLAGAPKSRSAEHLVTTAIHDLLGAAAPITAWLQHNGHGETDEHGIEDNANPGYGADLKHDYGPSEKKVKRLWEHKEKREHGNDNEPAKDGEPWNLGDVEKLIDVVSEPSKK